VILIHRVMGVWFILLNLIVSLFFNINFLYFQIISILSDVDTTKFIFTSVGLVLTAKST